MEYAAIFVLFILTAAAAMQLATNGKGGKEVVFLVVFFALLCVEPWGSKVKIAPSVILLSVVGIVHVIKSRDVQIALCTLCVSAATVSAAGSTAVSAGLSWVTVGCVALCALVCKGARAGTVYALGVTAGEVCLLLSDINTTFYLDLFTVQTAYAAVVCAVVARFFAKISEFCCGVGSDGNRKCLNRPLSMR